MVYTIRQNTMKSDSLVKFDQKAIAFLRKIRMPFARIAIFVVFFWFGFLKIIDASPANPLVKNLLEQTLPLISFEQFIVLFGIYEMMIGIVFLIPKWERAAMAMLLPHMITTFLPLILLPEIIWQSFFVPTLEGQYIIKNLVIIALAFGIAAELIPWQKKMGV